MAAQVCPRCQRANPGEAAYCYFDGGSLHARQDGPQRLAHDFVFPTGRRCQSIEEFANACQEDWILSRDLLAKDAFRQYFTSLGRHDLVRVAQEAMQQPTTDLALSRFINGLPVDRTNTPRLDMQPRKFYLGRLPAGEVRELDLSLLNLGKGTLQGTLTVAAGGDWISIGEGQLNQIRVQTTKEQRLRLRLDTRKLKSAQTYAGQLMVVTNGGVVEVPVRFELVAKPFAKAPFQGVRTPREMAERMRDNPKQAGPLLESGEVERWFAFNNWDYPVQGPIAKGLAGVQQFFEAMGLSRPPKLQLSQREVHFSTHYPDPIRFQVAMQTSAKKWVYGQVDSPEAWLKVLTPKVIGPQHANILFEADPKLMPKFPPDACKVQVRGNGGQKLDLTIFLEVKDAPRPPVPAMWQPVLVFAILLLLLRAALVPIVDLHVREAALNEAMVRVGVEAGPGDWLRMPWVPLLAGFGEGMPAETFGDLPGKPPDEMRRIAHDFRPYFMSAFVRELILWTWWIAALGCVAALLFGGEGFAFHNLVPSLIAGSVLGLLASATIACFFLGAELLPHALWSMAINKSGPAWHIVWPIFAVLCWTLIGAGIGVVLVAMRPVRAAIYPGVQRFVAGVFRLFRLRGLEKMVGAESR